MPPIKIAGSQSAKTVTIEELGSGQENSKAICSSLFWDNELHKRFMVGGKLLGLEATASNILGVMNVVGLTPDQVAVHLQVYKGHVTEAKGQIAKVVASSSNELVAGKKPMKKLRGTDEEKLDAGEEKAIQKWRAPIILPIPPVILDSTEGEPMNVTAVRPRM